MGALSSRVVVVVGFGSGMETDAVVGGGVAGWPLVVAMAVGVMRFL